METTVITKDPKILPVEVLKTSVHRMLVPDDVDEFTHVRVAPATRAAMGGPDILEIDATAMQYVAVVTDPELPYGIAVAEFRSREAVHDKAN